MGPSTIVSYDDTLNDQDALMLGRLLADAGARLTLAYVRHTTQALRSREELEEDEAKALLERGARWLGDLDVGRRVLVSGSTGEGLKRLAEEERAEVVVFGSDYRTAAGHVAAGRSAHSLLEGGPVAVAIAPANYRSDRSPRLETIGVSSADGDDAAVETARQLAASAGAVVQRDGGKVDLLVIGSRGEAPAGRVMITAQAQNAIERATSPVLVVARGVPLRFAEAVAAA
ncbi:MAG: universal stress protein [Solirubrobacteraceae bacterium]